MRRIRTFVLLTALATAAVLGSAANANALIGPTAQYANVDTTFTGWAHADTATCNLPDASGGIDNNRPANPYCSTRREECDYQPCAPIVANGVWTYSYTYRRWFNLADETQIYVYASPASSRFAWTWTPRLGFTVSEKSLIRTGVRNTCPVGAYC